MIGKFRLQNSNNYMYNNLQSIAITQRHHQEHFKSTQQQ